MRIGLVLGAGGAVGVAYHGAVLAAISDTTGWDPRDAEVIVGTSAGSITAAMLRAGVPAPDLRAISEGKPLSEEGSRLAEVGRPHRPRPTPAHFLSMRPLADPLAVLRGVTRITSVPAKALLAAAMPAGRVPTNAISDGINAVFEGRWPARPLWITAVGLRDGKRVVFGAEGAPTASAGDAVAASCAIPGYFEPVAIGGRRYVDGGVHSMVNLDLMAGLDLDLVVAISPMTAAAAWPALSTSSIMRHPVRFRFHGEVAALRRRGTPVAAIEPGRRVTAAMGFNPMDARARGTVSVAAYSSTRRWMAEHSDGRRLVASLAGATGGHAVTAGPVAV